MLALSCLMVALWASVLPGNMASVTNILFVSCWLVLICFLCLFKEHGSKHCCEILLIIHRASFLTKTVPSGNELHKFLIWDTAGQERVSAPTTEIPQWLTVCFKLTHDCMNHVFSEVNFPWQIAPGSERWLNHFTVRGPHDIKILLGVKLDDSRGVQSSQDCGIVTVIHFMEEGMLFLV